MDNGLVRCKRINVDCVENDPVDIRCGGPQFLGFDFNVKEEESEEMQKLISATLEIFKIPLRAIYENETIEVSGNDVWTKEEIVSCIKDNANLLIKEANSNCKVFRRK